MTAAIRTSHTSSRGIIKAAWRLSPPSRFLDYKDFLQSLHRATEKEVGRYTYQQFSSDLGFSSRNAAYVVVNGHRKLNHEQAQSIVSALGMTGAERRYFMTLLDYTNTNDESERSRFFQSLIAIKEQDIDSNDDRLMLKFFSEWHHAAIFEMVDLEDFRSDPDWIATRFFRRLRSEQVTKSLELLEQLGLIAFDQALGKHVKKDKSLSTGDEVRGLAVVGYHLQMMEMGQAALSQIPHDQREIGAVTLAVTPEIAERLKEDVRLFRRYALFLSEQCEKPDRIMQLNLQLFPITRNNQTGD